MHSTKAGKVTEPILFRSMQACRIMKHPANMKIAYMQQEADLDNGKTTFEACSPAF